jgi:hypothetical protein
LQAEATSTESAPLPQRALAPWIFIALGSIARVIWPHDFEWKYDEKWMFDAVQRIARGEAPWPWIGMPSGAGVQNPGASIWPFVALAHVTHDPATMTFIIMLLNVCALWGFAFWVQRTWPSRDRELGVWGVALFAVSPLPVLFSRKIWAQDVLPVLVVPWLWGHTTRKHFAGACAWGAFGALLGQVHMSGFFAAAALVLATVIADRKGTHWVGWFVGSAIAALPLLPWIQFLMSPQANRGSTEHSLSLVFFSDAFLNCWGLHLRYSLGKHFVPYLKGPRLFGFPTLLAAGAHVLLAGLALTGGWLAIRNWRTLPMPAVLRVHAMALVLCGIAMHAVGVVVYPHYLIVFSPIVHVLAVWSLAPRPRLWCVACGLQLFVTATFLSFIHLNGGAPRGDYGVAYSAQTPAQRTFEGTK